MSWTSGVCLIKWKNCKSRCEWSSKFGQFPYPLFVRASVRNHEQLVLQIFRTNVSSLRFVVFPTKCVTVELKRKHQSFSDIERFRWGGVRASYEMHIKDVDKKLPVYEFPHASGKANGFLRAGASIGEIVAFSDVDFLRLDWPVVCVLSKRQWIVACRVP